MANCRVHISRHILIASVSIISFSMEYSIIHAYNCAIERLKYKFNDTFVLFSTSTYPGILNYMKKKDEESLKIKNYG